jgi:hypothetical protein
MVIRNHTDAQKAWCHKPALILQNKERMIAENKRIFFENLL